MPSLIEIFKRVLKLVKPIYYKIFKNKKKYFVHKTAQLYKRDLIDIEKNVELWDFVIVRTGTNRVVIGENTQIGPFTVIYGGSGVSIGKNVMIAPHCMIAAGNHNYLQTEKPMILAGTLSKGPVVIEDDVWIGANCTITDGVTIKQGAVIGANSVITHDVSPFDVVVGSPAKVIRNRKKNIQQ